MGCQVTAEPHSVASVELLVMSRPSFTRQHRDIYPMRAHKQLTDSAAALACGEIRMSGLTGHYNGTDHLRISCKDGVRGHHLLHELWVVEHRFHGLLDCRVL